MGSILMTGGDTVLATAPAPGDVVPATESSSLADPAFLMTDSHASTRSAGGLSVSGSVLMTVCRTSTFEGAADGEDGEPSSDSAASSRLALADDFSSSFQFSSSPAANERKFAIKGQIKGGCLRLLVVGSKIWGLAESRDKPIRDIGVGDAWPGYCTRTFKILHLWLSTFRTFSIIFFASYLSLIHI